MKLKVAFSIDATTKDITEEIIIPSDICIYCHCDWLHHDNSLRNEIRKALEYKGYDFSQTDFELLKAYTL